MKKIQLLMIVLIVIGFCLISGCEEKKAYCYAFNSAIINDFYVNDIESRSEVGKIGGAFRFDGINDYLFSESEIDARVWNGVSFEAWVNADSFETSKNAVIVGWDNPGCDDNIWFRHVSSGFFQLIGFDRSEGPAETLQSSSGVVPTDVWVYLSGSWDGKNYPNVYFNGTLDNHATFRLNDVALSDLTDLHEVNIGFSGNNLVSQWWDGIIDEVRVSKIVRSASWFNTSFINQNDPASFYSIDVEEVAGSHEFTSWWNKSWLYRKKIIINHSKVGADLTNFPVLISFGSDTDFADDSKCQNDGDDIVFTNVNGTKLNHEIERFDNDTGELVAWVNVTDLSSSIDTMIFMYYGNSICSSQEDVAGTWDDDYVVVCHLN